MALQKERTQWFIGSFLPALEAWTKTPKLTWAPAFDVQVD
jgi:hypothetical protein